jgi:hypothetical protein
MTEAKNDVQANKTKQPRNAAQIAEPDMRTKAEQGDFDALLECLTGMAAGCHTRQAARGMIDKCLDTHSAKGTAHLVDELVQHVIKFDAMLLLRAEIIAAYEIHNLDEASDFIARSRLSPSITEQLERVARLQDRVMETALTYGKLRRMLSTSEREGALGKGILRLFDSAQSINGSTDGATAEAG